MDDCHEVIVPPYKENIKYSVIDVGDSKNYEQNLGWLVRLLRQEKIQTPRILLFFRKMTYLTGAYEFLDDELGSDGYINYAEHGCNDDRNHLLEMYHMKVQDEVKENIVKTCMDITGHIRVVLCSSSFSMGLNLRDVR